MRIFDFGFGDGELLKKLGTMLPIAELAGADCNAQMVQQARARLPAATLELADARTVLNQRVDTFDLIVLSHVLYYFEASHWQGLLEQLAESLSPTGQIAIALVSQRSDPYQEPLWTRGHKLRHEKGFHELDGHLAFAEQLASLPIAREGGAWDVPWHVSGGQSAMNAFLEFLYRVVPGDARPEDAGPEEDVVHFKMIDTWRLISREGLTPP